jgi:hypothetical protein
LDSVNVTNKASLLAQANNPRPVVVMPGGRVFLDPSAMCEDWSLFAKSKYTPPSAMKLSDTLSALACSSKATSITFGGYLTKRNLWELSRPILSDYLKRSGRDLVHMDMKLKVFYDTFTRTKEFIPTKEQLAERDEMVERLLAGYRGEDGPEAAGES